MINKLTDIIEKPKRDCIYDLLSHLRLNLCVDIGAAKGDVTKKLCSIGGDNTFVVAFEPFPGNFPYFYETTEGITNQVSLIKKAVSDSLGTVEFYVPSVIQGTEAGWGEYVGYSSVGYISHISKVNQNSDLLMFLKYCKSRIMIIFNTLSGQSRSQMLKVEATTIDNEFCDEIIDFMKMDVQGAEENVLRGANTLLQEKRVHILYLEWTGDDSVVEILKEYSYEVYDSTYIIGPNTDDISQFENIGFKCIESVNLSTGKQAYEMIIADDNLSPTEAIKEVKKQNLGWIQTDLIAISSEIKEEFLFAVKKYCKASNI